jgi:GDPmannose 4,6-dehydratase
MRKIIITGILGQDGSCLAEYLLCNFNDIKVYGMTRQSTYFHGDNCVNFINHENFELVVGDLVDSERINYLINTIQPDYLVNFAAISVVDYSWISHHLVNEVNAMGVLRCLEAIKNYCPDCKFYSAGSCEEFGELQSVPQDLNHIISPQNPYAISKTTARYITRAYREKYGLFAVHGTFYNHESPKRGRDFLSKKITLKIAQIKDSLENFKPFAPLSLGNIHSQKDWSSANDIVKGVWMMINQTEPKEYILASGETHKVKDWVDIALKHAGIQGEWTGDGMEEKFISELNGATLVDINEKFYRPSNCLPLCGDITETIANLGWSPETSFENLVKEMVEFDIKMYKNNNGHFRHTS